MFVIARTLNRFYAFRKSNVREWKKCTVNVTRVRNEAVRSRIDRISRAVPFKRCSDIEARRRVRQTRGHEQTNRPLDLDEPRRFDRSRSRLVTSSAEGAEA